jgi:hypothetical protein
MRFSEVLKLLKDIFGKILGLGILKGFCRFLAILWDFYTQIWDFRDFSKDVFILRKVYQDFWRNIHPSAAYARPSFTKHTTIHICLYNVTFFTTLFWSFQTNLFSGHCFDSFSLCISLRTYRCLALVSPITALV